MHRQERARETRYNSATASFALASACDFPTGANPMAEILIIDDDAEFSDALRACLQDEGHAVRCVELAEDGLRLVVQHSFDLILLDNKMPRMSGLDFLAALKKERANAPPVVLMTSAHNDNTAIQATKMGAFAYVIKPVDFKAIMHDMESDIHRALKVGRPVPPIAIPQGDGKSATDESVMIGRSKALRAVFQRIGLLEGDESVLILGETGTGKELVAQAIHTNSARQKYAFVEINCSALSPNLMESELFGHEKDAFTGATKMRKGYFEHANGGTLFLDEIGDMPESLQVKLLRVLESREITRMGSCDSIHVDVRILAATSRDLARYLREGKFRPDLYYRLEGTIIPMPALRDRIEDVELLAKHFLRRTCGEGPAPALSPEALQSLKQYSWPGNVRQLLNVMRRARIAVKARRGTDIMPEDLNFGEVECTIADSRPYDQDRALADLRRAAAWAWESEQSAVWPWLRDLLECELLRSALAHADISEVQLARRLGVSRNYLRDRLKQYGLKKPVSSDD